MLFTLNLIESRILETLWMICIFVCCLFLLLSGENCYIDLDVFAWKQVVVFVDIDWKRTWQTAPNDQSPELKDLARLDDPENDGFFHKTLMMCDLW